MTAPRAAKQRDPTIRSQLVVPVLAYVAERGGDVEALIREFQLPASAATAVEVEAPLGRLQAFFDAAARSVADPDLGLHVALTGPRGHWREIEYGARSAATVREALTRLARYAVLFNEHVVIAFEEQGGHGTLSQRIPGRPLCVGRHGNEFFVAVILVHLRASIAAAAPLVPERVFFAHPRPPSVAEHIRVLGTDRLEFGAERNGLVLAAAALDMPLRSRDPSLGALVDDYVNAELDRRGTVQPGEGLVAQVRARVRGDLEHGTPTLADIASAFHMSARSMQRRLAEDGTSFHAILQSAREELARVWVAASDRPLADIAHALGYAELTPFLRAFRRWTGMTPAGFRTRAIKAGTRT